MLWYYVYMVLRVHTPLHHSHHPPPPPTHTLHNSTATVWDFACVRRRRRSRRITGATF